MQPNQELGLLYIGWISYLGSRLIEAQPLLSSVSLIAATGASASVLAWNIYKFWHRKKMRD